MSCIMRHADYVTAIAKSARVLNYHFGAIVFEGRDIISAGWCQAKTHPKQARFMRFAQEYKRNNSYLHAEIHALISARRDVEGYDMAVARWSENKLKTSRPCGACHHAIIVAGIRRVWFWNETTKDWEWDEIC